MTPRAIPSIRALGLARLVALGIAGVVLVALGATPALAQMAGALGKPLPSPDLPVGTVSVRIVAGSPASPVVGTDVTLLVNDAPRAARTDAGGRATFAGLPVGATVIAKVLDQDKGEHASDPFPIPDDGGTRVMITTKPWQAGTGAAPAAGGAGMPNPRQLSGEPRPQQGDTPGTITVRVSYDDLQDTPEGVPVTLVGYAADNTTTVQVQKTDKAGRVQFIDLDRSGGTSYFAMTQLPRNGAVDRLVSSYTLLESQMGVRMVLSSEKRSSTAPPLDDLGKMDPQVATPAGQVRVPLEGAADLGATVTLIDAATKQVLGTTKPTAGQPDPSRVRGGAQFEPDAKLPAGTLDVEVWGGPGQTEEPLKDIEIRVIPASTNDGTGGVVSQTRADGTLRIALQVSEPQKAVFSINGRPFVSQPFDLTKSGGKLTVRAQWEATGRPQALFDVTPTPGQVVYAECAFLGQSFRSLPAQLLESTGTKISIIVYPRVRFRFLMRTAVEDELLAAQGRFEITNYAWSPYRAGPDGLVVPMPRGFKGAVVFGNDQAEVAVAADEGFRIMRPVPPGGRQFHGGFSLQVVDGKADWALDLPLGAFESELDMRQTPGMIVHTPPNVRGETRTVPEGTFFVIGPIEIKARQSMVMSIEGLPSPPAWRTWLPRVVGVLVVGVMLAGLYFALARKPVGAASASAARVAHRQRLLDELVEIERTGENPRRREQLLGELEDLWG